MRCKMLPTSSDPVLSCTCEEVQGSDPEDYGDVSVDEGEGRVVPVTEEGVVMQVRSFQRNCKIDCRSKKCSAGVTMEWMVMNMDRFFAPTIQLGGYITDDKYMVAPNCQAKIEEILRRLIQDKARWHFRRSLFMNKIISKNLLPTLIHVKEDRGLLEATIKVLQELMTPVECLMPTDVMGRNYEGRRIVHELESSLISAKKLFLETRVTKAMIDLITSVFQESKVLSLSECELINHCLLLVRNLLHVSNSSLSASPKNSFIRPSNINGGSPSSEQQGGSTPEVITEDQIMWNLFAQRFDNILIQLLTCEQQHLWNITMVQLISLMYREQQQGTIRKLINEWLELPLSESSEDDENNTMSSSSSDAISTSDPVSDSSERLSPVGEMNNAENAHAKAAEHTNNSENSSNGNSKIEKEDSCRDSGFGRSGSNMDSSPEESVSEGTNHPQKQPRSMCGVENEQLSSEETKGKGSIDISDLRQSVKSDTDTAKSQESENCNMSVEMPKINLCDMKILGECDGSESCGGSEGGSEGSSPVPVMEQESPVSPMENEALGLSQFIHGSQEVIVNEVSVLQIKEDCNHTSQLRITNNMDVTNSLADKAEQQVFPSGDGVKHTSVQVQPGSSDKKSPTQPPKLHKNKPPTGQKRSRHAMSQKLLNETQENNESSNSTGSDCDEGPQAKRPHHQKPHKMLSKPRPAKMVQKALQERHVNRTKLMKRKESNSIKAKALLHHHPTADDISNLLKEFTVDFMLNGYSNLVQGLRLQVMLPYQIDLDKSHVLWLITYFLRFAVELDLELSQICPVLSVDVVSYLVYEGVGMQEELERAVRAGEENLLPHVRRLHLVVTALREFFVAFDVCLKKESNLIDVKHLTVIKEELSHLVEVRQLFVLLIRMYRPGVLNLNYLQDLITTNHRFLTTQEAANSSLASTQTFDIVNHIRQFATMDIMRQYGRLLENFNMNDETVNDCIFTMMHHIAGDLRNVNVLLQPPILRTFLRIWKEGFELCVDWADLIEYILRKCDRVRSEDPSKKESKETQKILPEPTGIIELTNEDLDQLYTLYSASTSEQDLMDKIKEICCDDSIEEPIKKEVIQKLLARGFITNSECSKLCAEIPNVSDPLSNKSVGAVSLECDVMQVSSDSEDSMNVTRLPGLDHDLKIISKDSFKDVQHEGLLVLDNPFRSKEQDGQKQLGIRLSPDANIDNVAVSEHTESSLEGTMTCTEDSTDWEDNATLNYIIGSLKEEGYGSQVEWLQLQLLEACYSKLKIVGPDIPRPEPIAFHYNLSNQSIPIVPWTGEQEEAFCMPKFVQLLGEVGLHLPSDTGKIFPRIPHFWCPDVLFMMAKRLGPINTKILKVSQERLQMLIQQLRTLTLSSDVVRANGLEDDEYADFRCTSSLGCDDSSERVSDCSMENNRSTPSSSISSLDGKLTLNQSDDKESTQFTDQIPVTKDDSRIDQSKKFVKFLSPESHLDIPAESPPAMDVPMLSDTDEALFAAVLSDDSLHLDIGMDP